MILHGPCLLETAAAVRLTGRKCYSDSPGKCMQEASHVPQPNERTKVILTYTEYCTGQYND